MSFEPGDVMVEAAAKVIQMDSYDYITIGAAEAIARAALCAAFAAAVEAGEAFEGCWFDEIGSTFPALILRKPQEGEKP